MAKTVTFPAIITSKFSLEDPIIEDEDPSQPPQTNTEQPADGENAGEGDDIDITDEEMFQIAESTLLKIAHVFIMRGTTVGELYQNNIENIPFEDSNLPVISPEVFIEGLKVLEVENITELELA